MFCLECGSELQEKSIDFHNRKYCKNCDWVYYPHLKVSTAGIITNKKEILLLKQSENPWKGDWYLPAGYVEQDEDPVLAVKREIKEETGLNVTECYLMNIYFFDDDPRGNGILIVYRCSIDEGDFLLNHEIDEAKYFKEFELPINLCGVGHTEAIFEWKQHHEA
jgi:8-oxo-dGTP diphosphatase